MSDSSGRASEKSRDKRSKNGKLIQGMNDNRKENDANRNEKHFVEDSNPLQNRGVIETFMSPVQPLWFHFVMSILSLLSNQLTLMCYMFNVSHCLQVSE